jgi:hypothetical protein
VLNEDRGNSLHIRLVIVVRLAGTEALKRDVCLKLGTPDGCRGKSSHCIGYLADVAQRSSFQPQCSSLWPPGILPCGRPVFLLAAAQWLASFLPWLAGKPSAMAGWLM